MREISLRSPGLGVALLFVPLLLAACGGYDSHVPAASDERMRIEDRPDPSRDPGQARPVQGHPTVVR